MTTQEFSNAFDTLLNSYNHKAEFGDQSSYADVSLDEYEKSVFLTQAQDIIIKRYFERQNELGSGFDDSIRRQADFSSLITINKPNIVNSSSTWNTDIITFRGTINKLTGTGSAYSKFSLKVYFGEDEDTTPSVATVHGVQTIICKVSKNTAPNTYFSDHMSSSSATGGLTFNNSAASNDNYLGIFSTTNKIEDKTILELGSYPKSSSGAYDARGILYQMPSNVLLMLNEKVKSGVSKYYVVVPISYQEYDRQMSKAYAQPLKKQCWRLFQGESGQVSTISEIIPAEGVSISDYTIRYIRRPLPIILTNLAFGTSQEALNIDGHSTVTECELSPILHMDILNEAVRLALNSAGIETRDMAAARQAASK